MDSLGATKTVVILILFCVFAAVVLTHDWEQYEANKVEGPSPPAPPIIQENTFTDGSDRLDWVAAKAMVDLLAVNWEITYFDSSLVKLSYDTLNMVLPRGKYVNEIMDRYFIPRK